MLRFLTAGESHGQGLVVIVEGLPAGLGVTEADIADELARRRLGYGRGPRQRFEAFLKRGRRFAVFAEPPAGFRQARIRFGEPLVLFEHFFESLACRFVVILRKQAQAFIKQFLGRVHPSRRGREQPRRDCKNSAYGEYRPALWIFI